MQGSLVLALTTIMVFINNSCVAAERGTVNGLGQSAACLARMLGPWLGGVVFAWSEQPGAGGVSVPGGGGGPRR